MGAASESSTVGVALPRGTVTLVMTDIEGSTRLLQREGGGYVGLDVHRTARICSAAHGGQVVLSHLTATLAADDLPEGVSLRELGEVWRGGARVPLSAAKQRMIVAVLALRLGEVVSLDVLIDRLWGERPPRTAQKAVQVYVSELRKLVESDPRAPRVIVSQHPGYRLIAAPDELDLRRFERLWDTGREALAAGDAGAAREPLSDALALWRGPPLAEFRYEDAFSTDIGPLEEMHIGCLEDRIEADLRCGRHASVIGELEALVRDLPLRERLCGQLMLALYRSGRQAEALAAYGRARATLVEELG